MTNLLLLHIDHLPAVTTLLTDVFVSDVGMRELCPGATDAHYRQAIAAWFAATVHLHIATDQPAWVVVADDCVVGVALLTRPQARYGVTAWLRWVATVGRHCGWDTVWRTARHEQQRARYRPAQPHAVLEFIAVAGAYRGQGIATLLLATAQQWSATDAVATGIWLETTRPSNIPFFERYGYGVTGQMALTQGTAFFLFRPND